MDPDAGDDLLEPSGDAPPPDGGWETSVRWLLAALFLALPLAWHPALFDLYDGTKRMVAQVLVAVAMLVWAMAGTARGELAVRVARLPAALAAMLLLQALSVAVAINPLEALVELGNRLLWLCALFLGVQVVTRREHLHALLLAGAAGAALASLLGIAQSAGWSSRHIPQVAVPASLFGNKNMAAEYVLLWLPLSVHLMLALASPAARGAGAVTLGLASAYVFLTGTRATYVAIGVCGVALALGLWHVLVNERTEGAGVYLRRLAAGALIVVATWATVFVGLKVAHATMDPAQRRNPYGEANAAMTLSTFSSNWRLVVWTNTLAMIKDSPVLGVGLGNWRFHYPRYHRKIAIDQDFNSRVQADTPHNDYVQTFAETGLVGMAGLAVFLLALAFALTSWLAPRAGAAVEDRLAALAVLGLVLAYGTDAGFSFPMAKAAPTFVLFVTLGAAEGLLGARRVARGSAGAALVAANAGIGAAAVVLTGQACWAIGDVYFKAGLMLYNDGRVLEAHESLSKAYKYRPTDSSLAVFHGGIAQELGKTDEALKINLEARKQHPNFTNVLNQLGNIFWKKGQAKDAEALYKEVLSIHPEFVEALRNLASLCISQQRFEEARPLLETLTRKEPDDPAHWLDLGEVYRALHKRERSRETLTALVTRWPSYPRGQMALGHLSREEKRFADAERLYRRSMELEANVTVRFFLATLLADTGRLPESCALLREALAGEPSNAMVKRALDRVEKMMGKPAASSTSTVPTGTPTRTQAPLLDPAEQELREQLAREPRSPDLHARLAELYLRQGRFPPAVEELRRTVERDPKRGIAWAKLAKLALRDGRLEEANQLLLDGIKHSPRDPVLWNELGLLLQHGGAHDRALEAFENAAGADAVPAEVWYNVAQQRARAGRTAQAIEAYRRFLAEWKGEPGPRAQAEAALARLQGAGSK